MKNFYISFGQIHTHSLNGKTYDKNCIGVIKAKDLDSAREIAFDYFGRKWSNLYEKVPNMTYFPRGIFKIN